MFCISITVDECAECEVMVDVDALRAYNLTAGNKAFLERIVCTADKQTLKVFGVLIQLVFQVTGVSPFALDAHHEPFCEMTFVPAPLPQSTALRIALEPKELVAAVVFDDMQTGTLRQRELDKAIEKWQDFLAVRILAKQVVLYIDEDIQEPCAICYESIRSPSVRCANGHSWCYQCITAWWKKDIRCPTCRTTEYITSPRLI